MIGTGDRAFERHLRDLGPGRIEPAAVQFVPGGQIAVLERESAVATGRGQRRAGQRHGPAIEPVSTFSGIELRAQFGIEHHIGTAQRQLALRAIEAEQSQRPGKARLGRSHADLAVSREVLRAAIAKGKLRGDRRDGPGKAAAQIPVAVRFQADRAVGAVDPGPAIDHRQIEVGQAFGPGPFGKQHLVERAEADPTGRDPAIQARPGQCDPADRGRAECQLSFDHRALRRKVGMRGIADHHIGQHLAVRTDRFDLVRRRQAKIIQLAGDDPVRDPFARQIDARQGYQQRYSKPCKDAPVRASARNCCRFFRNISSLYVVIRH